MKTDYLWLLILGMGLVTYLPRLLPMVLLQNIKLNPFLNRFLGFIPFAALGALIFPGVLDSTGDSSSSSAIAGALVSVVLSIFRINIMFVVMGGILGVFLWGFLTV
ncbi:MAG TPA: AzlD domain-containing protein [Bacillota bacterium]|nr:AzlD domain-containing protein [Bacillota bacterium]